MDETTIPDERLELCSLLPPGARDRRPGRAHAADPGRAETEEIARAFLVPEATMAKRLVRAKHKIKAPGSCSVPPTTCSPTASRRCSRWCT